MPQFQGRRLWLSNAASASIFNILLDDFLMKIWHFNYSYMGLGD